VVKSVFKYLIGLFSGVILALIMTLLLAGGQLHTVASRMGWFTGLMVVFGLLGCLFTEMLIRKRLNVWKTAYKGLVAFALSVIALMLFIRFDGCGFEQRVPDQNNVVSVSFSASSGYYSNTELLHTLGEGYFRTMGANWSFTGEYIERQRLLDQPYFNENILNEIKLRTPEYFESQDAIATALELHRSLIESGWVTDDPRVNVDIIAYTFTLTYTLENGRIMVREYALPMAPAPEHDSIPLIIELYNKPEALNKRNRFIEIPDDLIRGAAVSGDVDWRVINDYYPFGLYQTIGVSRDDLKVIIEALRLDHAAGTLGRVGYTDIISSIGFNFGWPLMTTVDLILDSTAAGVPGAFSSNILFDENGNIYSHGLQQTIIINSEQVNTLRALQELGLP